MSLPLDATGVSPAHLVSNELHLTSTIFTNQYSAIYPNKGPFYRNSLVLKNINSDGVTKQLAVGVDYRLVYPLPNIRAGLTNEVYGAIRLVSERLNGTVEITYQALGGSWAYDQAQINTYQLNNYLNPNLDVSVLVPNPDVYPANSPVSLESFFKIAASLEMLGPIRLGVLYKSLLLVDNAPEPNSEMIRLLGLLVDKPLVDNTEIIRLLENVAANTDNKNAQLFLILNTAPAVFVQGAINKYILQSVDPERPGGYVAQIPKLSHGLILVSTIVVTKGFDEVSTEIRLDSEGTISIISNLSLDGMIVKVM